MYIALCADYGKVKAKIKKMEISVCDVGIWDCEIYG